MPQTTDEQLILAARRGDVSSQQTLWRRHRRWVAAIVLAHKPRAVEVDDLLQDVALKLVARIGTLRTPGAFRPWLRRIAINTCRGAARNLRPTLHLQDGDGDPDRPHGPVSVADDVSPSTRAVRRESAQRLLDQVMTLPADYREPLLLRCMRSMTYQQIGEVLGLPVTTIETRLARARRMLREELGVEMSADE